jgi:integrase
VASILAPRSELEYRRLLLLAFGQSGPPFPAPIAPIEGWSQGRRIVLRAAMRRALELSGMDEDEARKIARKTVLLDARPKVKKVRGPTEEEAERVAAEADKETPVNRALVRLLMQLGLRSDSLLNLERPDVERALKPPHLLVFRQKGGSDVSLPAEYVQAELQTLLKTPRSGSLELPWLRVGEILSPTNGYGAEYHALWSLVRRLGTQAGLTRHLAPHALRHYYASWVQAQGGDIYLTMQAMGHKSISSTLKYVDVDIKKLAAAMRPPPRLAPDQEWEGQGLSGIRGEGRSPPVVPT